MKRGHKFILSVSFSLIVYIVLFWSMDFANLVDAFFEVGLLSFLAALFFGWINLLLNYLRWEVYLRQSDIRIPKLKSLHIFFSGLTFSILPAKSGNISRFLFLKKENIPVKKSIPIFFVSNISELFVFLAFSGFFIMSNFFDALNLYLIILLSCMAVFFIFRHFFIDFLSSLLGRKKNKEGGQFVSSLDKLLKPKNLAFSILFVIGDLVTMFLSFYTITNAFGLDAPIFLAYSIYLISLILGAVSMLPGGTGVVEGSSIFLLSSYMEVSFAAAIIFLMRLIYLWIEMLIGMVTINLGILDKWSIRKGGKDKDD